jgi:hypothetical protein
MGHCPLLGGAVRAVELADFLVAAFGAFGLLHLSKHQ